MKENYSQSREVFTKEQKTALVAMQESANSLKIPKKCTILNGIPNKKTIFASKMI